MISQNSKNQESIKNIRVGEAKERTRLLSKELLDSLVKASVLGLISESHVLSDNIFRFFINLIKKENIPCEDYVKVGFAEPIMMLFEQSILFLENLSRSGKTNLLRSRVSFEEGGKGGLQIRYGVEKLKLEFDDQFNVEKKQQWFKKIKGFSIDPYCDIFCVGIQLLKEQKKDGYLLKWGKVFSKITRNHESALIYPFLINAKKKVLEFESQGKKNIQMKINELEAAFSSWRNSRKKKKAWQEELKKSKPEEQIIYEQQRELLCKIEKRKKARIKSIREDLETIQSTFDDLRLKVNPIFKELVESRDRIIRFIHKDKLRRRFFCSNLQKK